MREASFTEARSRNARVAPVLAVVLLGGAFLAACSGRTPAQPGSPGASLETLGVTTCEQLAASPAAQASLRDVNLAARTPSTPFTMRFGDVDISFDPEMVGRELRLDMWRTRDSRWILKMPVVVVRPSFSTLRMSGQDLATGAPVEFGYSADGLLVSPATYIAAQGRKGGFYGEIAIGKRGIVELVYELDGEETARFTVALCQSPPQWQSIP